MQTVDLNTIILDGMYMDIYSIRFNFNKTALIELKDDVLKLINDNPTMNISLINNDVISVEDYFNSTIDDKERTTKVDSRIGTELLSINKYGIYYVGYSKYTSDYLEVELTKLIH